jgi:hypothetical protein
MKLVGMGLATLVAITSALAYPLDIENNARWVVLDGLAEQRNGTLWDVEVTQLRTRDWAREGINIAAVCGALDFKNADDGVTNFVIYYAVNDQGTIGQVGKPYFYGTLLADPNFDPQQSAAHMACGDAELTVEASR